MLKEHSLLRRVRKQLESEPALFAGRHHARYHDPDVPYHIICRVFQGRYLLKPSRELNALIAGVVARALKRNASVQLFAITVLSNHLHMMLQGSPREIPEFVRSVTAEVARRWGQRINWRGGMWTRYISTALPTIEDQERCLKYILGQGVQKENLVERPEQWPGIHAAKQLALGEPLVGTWLRATAYRKAKSRYHQKLLQNPESKPKPVDKAHYTETVTVTLTPWPGWAHLSVAEQQEKARAMVEEIVNEAQVQRKASGKRVLGAKAILKQSRSTSNPLPRPPWFEERKPRMVLWGNRNSPEARSYLEEYWAFQLAFRKASHRFLRGAVNAEFPERAFRPWSYKKGSPEPAPREAAA